MWSLTCLIFLILFSPESDQELVSDHTWRLTSAVLMAIPGDDKSCFDQCGKATVEPEENSSINSTSTYGSKVQYNSTSTLVSEKGISMTT